ncbi:hypothetical protein MKW94_013063 [Papaver nudicaule]|uniref:Uncharacterized protein n=1 Tax=Papaver nudicaule TaxID=74823 RepID=A0AA41VPG1_PAPNU|nr:hypothetical protein [Papaver nudicaule]
MSFKSFPTAFALFLFGILALNAYSDMASAQTCQPGQRGWTFPLTLTCVGCNLKCMKWCFFGGGGYTYSCKGTPGWFTNGCLCCCGTATPLPPAPSPPPPPPPPAPIVQGLCYPAETSLSTIVSSCSTCNTPTSCAAKCAGIGKTQTLDGCQPSSLLCSCCCS